MDSRRMYGIRTTSYNPFLTLLTVIIVYSRNLNKKLPNRSISGDVKKD